ncbi:hypothetical protein STCU_00719 [Strigomonas culicis]|uniref:Uncharacterized protein n=1 Tax=Strigomonas culicis TaxID=28005 RepID=S9UZB6_9TRYP|nr:hypothetical protein STCU_04660 [Strigomonas culicis]EPY36172.1 hypothetical protein STCU_00719 [Strigomonas culicis]|eukprot:EPY29229.1 hypothetical protein STCU_04660 [Strigomonas culicis]
MLAPTAIRRIGLLSTLLANGALYAAHLAQLSQPYAVLVLAGGVYRAALTLPLSLYGDLCVARAAAALPELHEAHAAYTAITEHPRAIVWEKKVAAQKLTNDRARIFRAHRINNVKLFLPHALAGGGALYCLGLPAQQVADFLTREAGLAIVSPLAVTVALPHAVCLDPTLGIAVGLTCYNTLRHLRSRRGFNDGMDRILRRVQRGVVAACGAALLAAALPAGGAPLLPPYLAPVWLGMAGTTLVVGELAHRTGPGRALCRLPPRPASHGRYGPVSTAEGHDYRLAFTGTDRAEKHDMWCAQKRALDYECDIRLQRILRRVGLFDDLEELDYEADKLRRKREVAAARRLARGNEARVVDAETAEVESIGSYDPVARRAAARQAAWSRQPAEADAGPSAEEMAFQYLDAYQEQQQERRHARQAARAAALGMASPTADLDGSYQTQTQAERHADADAEGQEKG